MNRLGDYVSTKGCSSKGSTCRAKIFYTSASGIGPDRAKATSYWWKVQSKNTGFHTDTTTLTFEGKRGTDTARTKKVTVPVGASSALRDRKNYVAVLNGFDLLSEGDAGKPIKLEMDVSTPRYNAATHTVSFDVHALTNFKCSSQECSTDGKSNYELRISTALVGGDRGLAVTSRDFNRAYKWADMPTSREGACGLLYDSEKKSPGKELTLAPLQRQITGSTQARSALLAFRKLSLKLDDEHHMLGFNTAIIPGKYDHKTYNFALDLAFINWSNDMTLSEPPFSQCSHGNPGSAKWDANVALLQFKNGLTEFSKPAQTAGKSGRCHIDWPGLGHKIEDPVAECVKESSFKLSI